MSETQEKLFVSFRIYIYILNLLLFFKNFIHSYYCIYINLKYEKDKYAGILFKSDAFIIKLLFI